jgi:hypothetical protein
VATAAYHGDRPSFPPSPRAWSVIAGAADGPIGCALTFLFVTTRRGHERANQNRPAFVPVKSTITREIQWLSRRECYAVGCRSRGRALRPKNNAWLATAETTASWNGLAIRNAGSGRWPVRKRSG